MFSSSSASAPSAAPATPALLKTATVLPPKGDHKFTIVWLHGLGDQGSSFVDIFDMLSLPKGTKVILPNAPVQPVTCNGGYKMPSWFDIYVLGNARDFTGKQDDEGTLKSAAAINELIDAEVAALGSARRVFLGGFSQGGALTLHVGLNYKEKLGGLVVCSAYYPLSYNEDKYLTHKTDVPLLMYHGTADPIVPLAYARKSKEFLEGHGVEFTKYIEEPGLQHSLSPRELPVIATFIKDAMNQATA